MSVPPAASLKSILNCSSVSAIFADGTSTFNFIWNTSGLLTGCYNLVVTLDDTTQNATIVHLTTKIVFPTAGKYAGNLGGTTGADATCKAEAASAKLHGTYKAWLSTDIAGDNPATTFTQSNVPYVLADGKTQVAANWAGLVSGTLQATTVVSGGPGIWTGTQSTGLPLTPPGVNNNCNGWKDGTGNYTGGFGTGNGSDPQWSASNYTACSQPVNLLCVQQ